MKLAFKVAFAAVMVMGLAACGDNDNKKSGGAPAPAEKPGDGSAVAPLTVDQRLALADSNEEVSKALAIVNLLPDPTLSNDQALADAAAAVKANAACEITQEQDPETGAQVVTEVKGAGCPLSYVVTMLSQSDSEQSYRIDLKITDDALRAIAKTRFASAELVASSKLESDTKQTSTYDAKLVLADGSEAKSAVVEVVEVGQDRATVSSNSAIDTKSVSRNVEFRTDMAKVEVYTADGLDASSTFVANGESITRDDYYGLSLFGL